MKILVLLAVYTLGSVKCEKLELSEIDMNNLKCWYNTTGQYLGGEGMFKNRKKQAAGLRDEELMKIRSIILKHIVGPIDFLKPPEPTKVTATDEFTPCECLMKAVMTSNSLVRAKLNAVDSKIMPKVLTDYELYLYSINSRYCWSQ